MAKHFFFILVMLVSSTAAFGLSPRMDHCEFVFKGEATDDSDILELLALVQSGGAVNFCTGVNGGRGYSLASAVSQKDDVSYFYKTRVFRKEVDEGHSWEFTPPLGSVQMGGRIAYVRSGVDDVRQDAEGFVSVFGMPIDEFRALRKAWREIGTAKWLFWKAASNMSLINMFFSFSDTWSLRKALYDDGKGSPSIGAVNCFKRQGSVSRRCALTLEDIPSMWSIEFVMIDDTIGFESVYLTQLW